MSTFVPNAYENSFNNQLKQRHSDLAVTNPVQSLYQQDLFDLNCSDGMIAFYKANDYHPLWRILPVSNTLEYRRKENFLNYTGYAGTAAGTATHQDAVIVDPCGDGCTFEYGFCSWEIEGFNRLRCCTPVRDINYRNVKLCENDPLFDIAGNIIDNDFEWDVAMLSDSILRAMHYQLVQGNSANAGEVDGMLAQVTYGYVDPVHGEACEAMDSTVVDWAGNDVCPDGGTTGVTVNGVAVPVAAQATLTLIDIIKAYVKRTDERIFASSVGGFYRYFALIDSTLLECIIDCYVCYTVCGGDIERMDAFEARARLEELRSQLGQFGAVTLTFDGRSVTFVPWQVTDAFYDSVTGQYSILFFIPQIGNYRVWEVEFLDFAANWRGLELVDSDEFMITDNGRWLHMAEREKTCYKRCLEVQFRVLHRAPWTSMLVNNIACDSLFGHFSFDSLSDDYLGGVTKTAAPTTVPLGQ